MSRVRLAVLAVAAAVAAGRRTSSAEAAFAGPCALATAVVRRAAAPLPRALAPAAAHRYGGACRGVGVRRGMAARPRDEDDTQSRSPGVARGGGGKQPSDEDPPALLLRTSPWVDRLLAEAEAPWLLPYQYAQAAQAIADQAPQAFEQFSEHGEGREYRFMSYTLKVYRAAMATHAVATSAGGDASGYVREASTQAADALRDALERLRVEEAIWIAEAHTQECAETGVSPVSWVTWRRLEVAVEEADLEKHRWGLSRISARLREEVKLDQQGRQFDPDAWAKLAADMAASLPVSGGAMRNVGWRQVSAEDVAKHLAELRSEVEAPWRLPFQYLEAAQAIADFAVQALERYRGHGAGPDSWIIGRIYEVDRQVRAAASNAVSADAAACGGGQRAAAEAGRVLAQTLEKLQIAEAIWAARDHLDLREMPGDPLVSPQAWRQLEVAVEETETDPATMRRLRSIASMLREEMRLDREALRPFDPSGWAELMADIVAELCPQADGEE